MLLGINCVHSFDKVSQFYIFLFCLPVNNFQGFLDLSNGFSYLG